ncbi:MAG: DoxX family protein [Solirubrobacteraceae bacterium]
MPTTSTARTVPPAHAPAPARERLRLIAPAPAPATSRVAELESLLVRWLVAHSLLLLRVSVGFVFLAFGALKLFPGVSPAEDLVRETTRVLTLGLVPGPLAVPAVGALECVIGACLLAGRALRCATCLLATLMIGILSPLVLLAPRLFSGAHHAPTLEGQYVLKDLILVAAALVLAASSRGAVLQRRARVASAARAR